jgi:hypothetical protein
MAAAEPLKARRPAPVNTRRESSIEKGDKIKGEKKMQ